MLRTGGDKAKQAVLLHQQAEAMAAAAAAAQAAQHHHQQAEAQPLLDEHARAGSKSLEWQPVVQPAVKRQRSRLWAGQQQAGGAAHAGGTPEQAAVPILSPALGAEQGQKVAHAGRRGSATALKVLNSTGEGLKGLSNAARVVPAM